MISHTESYQKYKDCGYGYKVVCCYDDKYSKYSKTVQIYRGENAVHKFMAKMFEQVEWCKRIKHKHFNKDMILTEDDEQNFKNADKCYICMCKRSLSHNWKVQRISPSRL